MTACHYYSDRLSLCILCIPVQHGISFDCRSGHFYGKLEKGDINNILDKFEETYPNKDMKYYFYAVNKVYSEKACRKLMKKNYDVYDLGSFMNYREKTEGLLSSRKNRRRKK